jgi:hypothetical protein
VWMLVGVMHMLGGGGLLGVSGWVVVRWGFGWVFVGVDGFWGVGRGEKESSGARICFF